MLQKTRSSAGLGAGACGLAFAAFAFAAPAGAAELRMMSQGDPYEMTRSVPRLRLRGRQPRNDGRADSLAARRIQREVQRRRHGRPTARHDGTRCAVPRELRLVGISPADRRSSTRMSSMT